MSEFQLYFELGTDHILDINGYDHILFVISLSALYFLADWKNVLILVTAFTIGHSITLALSTLGIITIDSALIEFLIPLTILITAITNLFTTPGATQSRIQMNYIFAAFFGLIHGLGFSNYLKSLLGTDSSIVTQLLAFNLGIEVGQIIIVGVYLLISAIFISLLGVSRRDLNLVTSSAIAGVAITLLIENKYW